MEPRSVKANPAAIAPVAPSTEDGDRHDRYTQLFEAVGDAIIVIDAFHRVIEFNEEAERIFGYAKAEMLNRPIDLLLPDSARHAHGRHIESFSTEPVQRRQMRQRTEVHGLRKNGDEFDAEVTIAKIKSGAELQYLAVVRDISTLKWMERHLNEATQHLEQAQQLAGLCSVEMDIRTGTVTWSSQMHKILGLSPDTPPLSRERFMAMVHQNDRAVILKRFNDASASRTTTMSADLRITRADGIERTLQGVAEFVWGDDSQLLRLVSALQDVTEERAAAEQIRLSNERLQRAQELTKLGSWEWDPRTKQIVWSDQLYRLMGIEPGSIIPSSDSFMSIIHPDDRTQDGDSGLAAPIRAMASAGKPPEEYEFRIRRADGAERWAHGRLQAIQGPDGQVERVEGDDPGHYRAKGGRRAIAPERGLAQQSPGVGQYRQLGAQRGDGRDHLVPQFLRAPRP